MVALSDSLDKNLRTSIPCTQTKCESQRLGAYSPAVLSADLSQEAYKKAELENKNLMWKDSVKGRAAIRVFSRGIMGAAFFALGSMTARTYGKGYVPTINGERYSWKMIAEEAWKEEAVHLKLGKFITHGIARAYDDVFGGAIKGAGHLLGYSDEACRAMVNFRPTRMYQGYKNTGRSLGHEVVGLTLDFASASIGDALGRDIADWFDPNVKHDIYDKKGNFDIGKATGAAAKAVFRYVTYNAGEDWAVAVPYAYFVRAQRGLLNRIDKGFAYDSDRALNGASFKLDDNNKIVGNYHLTGVVDLQSRFTAYNIMTLMYREVYSNITDRLQHFQNSGYNISELFHDRHGGEKTKTSSNPISTAIDSAASIAKWVARDIVKGTLYMTPAVPFFWVTRAPQMNYRGIFIHPEKGLVLYKNPNNNHSVECLHAYEPTRSLFNSQPLSDKTPLYYSNRNEYHSQFLPKKHLTKIDFNPLLDTSYNETGDWKKFNPNSKTYGIVDSILHPFGVINDSLRKAAHTPGRILSEIVDSVSPRSDSRPRWDAGWESFSDMFVNSSISYTPYFFMKSDVLAKQWDTGKMDYAIEGMIDGATSLSPGKFAQGIGEIWNSMWHKPFADPAREFEAQKRVCNDLSSSDSSNMNSHDDCIDDALKDLSGHKRYQKDEKKKAYVENLQNKINGNGKELSSPSSIVMPSQITRGSHAEYALAT